jgi:hypothetical protein
MTEGIDSMLTRIEDRIGFTQNAKVQFMNIQDYNDLVYNKTGLIQYFFEMEDELKEYILFIKSLAQGYIDSQEQVLDLNNRLSLSDYRLQTTEETMYGLREDC